MDKIQELVRIDGVVHGCICNTLFVFGSIDTDTNTLELDNECLMRDQRFSSMPLLTSHLHKSACCPSPYPRNQFSQTHFSPYLQTKPSHTAYHHPSSLLTLYEPDYEQKYANINTRFLTQRMNLFHQRPYITPRTPQTVPACQLPDSRTFLYPQYGQSSYPLNHQYLGYDVASQAQYCNEQMQTKLGHGQRR